MISNNTFPKLSGRIVNLRELSVKDAQGISHLMNHNISKYLYDVPNPYLVQDALNFIKTCHSDFKSLRAIHFAIEYKGSKSEPRRSDYYPLLVVECIGLKNIDLVNRKANLGYWIGEQYWERGIATECVALVIDYAFFSSDLELKEISTYVFPDNKASIRVLEKKWNEEKWRNKRIS
jgi:RimJ/RimL family protein N-acetyltransferase